MAVAAGAMQVAAIKKQQQASQAQGYGEGGFTRKKLVASPVARPLIEALDYAQRTNTIGSLRSADVCINWAAAWHKASELTSALALHQFSRSITAPMALAQSQPQVIVQESKDLKDIIARLNERLSSPVSTSDWTSPSSPSTP